MRSILVPLCCGGASCRWRVSCALFLLIDWLVPAVAVAQVPGTPRIDPVFVSATRSPQPLTDLTSDVTVIGKDEIGRSGAQSLPELLQRQPGVEIVQNGGPGATSGVFLRGANRGQTLVLIDGVRLASATVGATSLEAIALDLIDHIEILRGPASSLYGADAIGGVIQVFTRRGERALSANATVGYGTYATRSIAAGISGSAGPATYAVQAGGRRSDGFSAIVDPANFSYNPDPDGYSNGNVSASTSLQWQTGQSLTAQYFRSRLDNQFDAGIASDDRTVTTLESWQFGSVNRLADWWTSTLTAGTGSDRSASQTGDGDFVYATLQRQYTWQNAFILPSGMLTAGFERLEQHVSGADFAVDSRNTNSVYATYQLAAGPQAFQANVRHDDSTQYGGKTTGSLAYGYRLSPAWRVSIGAGTAFKAPSFNDLYYPGFSNPDLEPETARNVEVGVYWGEAIGEAVWQARAVGWYNRVDQLIVFGCDANFVCRPDNVDRARLTGATLAADVLWRQTTLKGSLDLQSPEDARTGNLLPRRARSHGALSLLQQAGPVSLGAEVVASGRRFDDPANRIPLAGYAIVNLSAEWAIGQGVNLLARGDNVLDRNYELAAGYATGGAQYFVGLRWQR